MGKNSMTGIVEEFLVFRYYEKFGAALDTIDVLDRRVTHQLFQNRHPGEVAELGPWLGVIQFATSSGGSLAKGDVFRHLELSLQASRGKATDQKKQGGRLAEGVW